MTEHPTADDQKRALLEAAEAAVEDIRTRTPPQAHRRREGPHPVSLGLALLASGFGIYMLVAQPAWFVTPPPPPEPAVIQDASARLTLIREASRIARFRATAGRLPESLAEAGSPVAGVTYRVGSGGFLLHLVAAGDTVALSSRDSLPLFLGRSLDLVMARGGRRP